MIIETISVKKLVAKCLISTWTFVLIKYKNSLKDDNLKRQLQKHCLQNS